MDYFLNIPNRVDKVIRILARGGYDAYIVGGCVRDILMGRKPSDWDITTSATPEETRKCFDGYKVVDTGIKHGTVTVIVDGEPFEITTFRQDGTYSDGRHPDSVEFSKDINVDLSRRDFTMNALAYSPAKGIIDNYGGIEDIKNRVIKAVGDPRKRFEEDSLRIMRAIRFAGTLGFVIEPETARAIKNLAGTTSRSSAERIMTELNKLLMGAYAAYAIKVYRHEIDEAIAFSGAHLADRRSIKSLEHAPASLPLRLALVLDVPDEGKQMSIFGIEIGSSFFGAETEADIKDFRDALRKMKYDNDTIKMAAALKEMGTKKITPDELIVRLEMRKLAEGFDADDVPDILMDGISVRSLRGKISDSTTEELFGIIQEIVSSGKCYARSQLNITGDDLTSDEELKNRGLKQGKDVGRILSALLDEVIAGELENDHESLLTRSRSIYSMFAI